MTDTKKIWKGVGITAGILVVIYALGWLITGKGNPMNWFTPATPKEGDDCKMADGRDGKINASGSCVAPSGQRVSGEELRRRTASPTFTRQQVMGLRSIVNNPNPPPGQSIWCGFVEWLSGHSSGGQVLVWLNECGLLRQSQQSQQSGNNITLTERQKSYIIQYVVNNPPTEGMSIPWYVCSVINSINAALGTNFPCN